MFFWIGGFFLGFVMVDPKKQILLRKGGPLSIVSVIFHRLLRIWPCYLLAIFILWKVIPFIGTGPRWFLGLMITDCSTWWRNLLFIDNLFHDMKFCLPWGWYLSNDI
jgi:peptidoglycan/LPS O-acetylase OafA/YrhL